MGGGGGGGDLAERNLGGTGGKNLKIFEIFIPEIAANASNFKKLAHIYGDLIYYYLSLSISRKLLGRGGGRPLPLATALLTKDSQITWYKTVAGQKVTSGLVD